MDIRERVRAILRALPEGVTLVAATKGRSAAEILEAVEAGVKIVGENYVQEAERKHAVVSREVSWHFIGHLQRNKVRQALRIFDLIETVDSAALAREIDRVAGETARVMPVLIEVNIAGEPQKSGVLPEQLEGFLDQFANLPNLAVRGLMTMGPPVADPEDIRPWFRKMREMRDRLRDRCRENISMDLLSMGMSDTWKPAVEEGATLVRVGTAIFGPRN